jgi:8-oxo-dGTP pyrophosphatase MutT (NUDIX family)
MSRGGLRSGVSSSNRRSAAGSRAKASEVRSWRTGPRGEARRGRKPRLHTKVSFGVILTRINAASRRPEAILVRGRYSYEYAEFVHGRYSRKNVRAVGALLDAMSVNERLDIYSLDFAQMWYRVWLTTERRELFNKKLAKFQTAWMRDDSGECLRRLIQASRTAPGGGAQRGGGARWEFPKGKRQSNREPDLNCAIREFAEEAGIAKRDYQLLPEFKRRVSYVHMGVRYVNVYYAAVARRDLRLFLDFRVLDQVAEVSEVRWMDIEQIRLIDTPARRLEKTVAPAFKYVKRHVRGLVPSRGLPFRPAGPARGARPRRDLASKDSVSIGLARDGVPPARRAVSAAPAEEKRGPLAFSSAKRAAKRRRKGRRGKRQRP